MAAVPQWLTGRFVSSVTVTPLDFEAATGNLIAGTVAIQTLTGLVDEIDVNGEETTENIVALTSTRDNEVPIEDNTSISLTEILRSGAGNSLLAKCWATAGAGDYAQVSIVRDQNTWTFVGVMQSYSESLRKGKSVARMNFVMADIGNASANPTLATAGNP